MHPYQVCIINTQGKRVAEHTFRCADDFEAVAKAGCAPRYLKGV